MGKGENNTYRHGRQGCQAYRNCHEFHPQCSWWSCLPSLKLVLGLIVPLLSLGQCLCCQHQRLVCCALLLRSQPELLLHRRSNWTFLYCCLFQLLFPAPALATFTIVALPTLPFSANHLLI